MKVLIIGAGITGLFTAYYLSLDGYDVTLIDRNIGPSNASVFNAGLITPTTGVIPRIGASEIARSFFVKSGPIYISPMEIFRNLKWFKIASTKARRGYENAIKDLGRRSLALYSDLFKDEAVQPDIISGIAGLYINEAKARSVAQESGTRFIGEEELLELGFKGIGGAAYSEEELSINPFKLYKSLALKITNLGVKFVHGSSAELREKLSEIQVSVDGSKITGDKYVITCGSWTSQILKRLRYNALIIPARGLALLFSTQGNIVAKIPSLLEDYGIAVCQHERDLLRATGFFEIAGFNEHYRQSRKDWLSSILRKHLVNFSSLKLTTEGVGFRPCTPDQMPVIGKIPDYDNVYVASGNCRLGLTLAPASAEIISSMISLRPPLESSCYFDPTRFLR